MSKKDRRAELIGARLKEAIDKWPDGGVRTLRDRLQKERPRPRGSTYAMIHRYRGGDVVPPLEFIRAAARILNVSEAWLAGRDSNTGGGANTWTVASNDDADALVRQVLTTKLPEFEEYPEWLRTLVVELVDAWSEDAALDFDLEAEGVTPDEVWRIHARAEAAFYVGTALSDALDVPRHHLPADFTKDVRFLADVANALIRRLPTSRERFALQYERDALPKKKTPATKPRGTSSTSKRRRAK